MNHHPSLQNAREFTYEAYQNRFQSRDFKGPLIEGLKLAEQFNDQPLIAQSHVAIANFYATGGVPLKALYHLNEAQAIYNRLTQETSHSWWLTLMHSIFGIVYDDLTDYSKALTHHLQSLTIARELQDKESIARGLLNYGHIHLQMGNGNEAISYLTQASTFADFPYYVSGAYEHLGDAYQMIEQYIQARNNYMKSVEIETHLDRKALTLAKVSLCMMKLGEVNEAHHILGEIDAIHKSVVRLGTLTLTKILIARSQLAIASADYELAMTFCQKALKIAEDQHNEIARMEVLFQYAEVFQASGQYENSTYRLIELLDQNLPFYLRLSTSRLLIKGYKSAGEWQLAFDLLEELNQTQLISQSKIFAVQALLDAQQQEKVLNRKNQELKELNHEKDELLQIVAHDLKNPLSATQLTLHLLLNKSEGRPLEWMLPRIERVNGSIENTFGIVSQLTTAALLEIATGSNNTDSYTFINLMDVVQSAVTDHLILAEEKQQQIVINTQIPSIVEGNEMWLSQIISNLLSNAIKYSDSGSTTQIFMSKCWEGRGICLEIKDEGLGLNEDDLHNMFQKFNRLSSTPTGRESSTGLGLYIAKMLTEKMGGTISAESSGKNQGSCFCLKLPIAES